MMIESVSDRMRDRKIDVAKKTLRFMDKGFIAIRGMPGGMY